MNKIILIFCLLIFACTRPPKNIGDAEEKLRNKKRQNFEQKLQKATYSQKKNKNSLKKIDSLQDIFQFNKPNTWKRVKSTQFRLINFSFNKTGEVYMFLSRGSAGGLLANVNRWRQQFSLPIFTENELKKESKFISFFGKPANYFDFKGTYINMAGKVNKNWRILGVLSVSQKFSIFIKMLGSLEEIAKEKNNFEYFCKTFSIKNNFKESINNNLKEKKKLSFNFPKSWKVIQGKSNFNYLSATKDKVKLTISRLSGSAGGVKANYLRWCRQLGLINIPNYQNFEQVKILEKSYSFINLFGQYRGMTKQIQLANAKLLGFIIPLSTETIFIKLITSQNKVNEKLENEFKSIVKSMTLQ